MSVETNVSFPMGFVYMFWGLGKKQNASHSKRLRQRRRRRQRLLGAFAYIIRLVCCWRPSSDAPLPHAMMYYTQGTRRQRCGCTLHTEESHTRSAARQERAVNENAIGLCGNSLVLCVVDGCATLTNIHHTQGRTNHMSGSAVARGVGLEERLICFNVVNIFKF